MVGPFFLHKRSEFNIRGMVRSGLQHYHGAGNISIIRWWETNSSESKKRTSVVQQEKYQFPGEEVRKFT